MAKQFDAASNTWELAVTGTGFTGAKDQTDFIVGGRAQTIKSISSTELVVTVTNVTSGTIANADLFFDVGVPKGASVVKTTVTLDPKLVGVTPSAGSVGGSLIIANV